MKVKDIIHLATSVQHSLPPQGKNVLCIEENDDEVRIDYLVGGSDNYFKNRYTHWIDVTQLEKKN